MSEPRDREALMTAEELDRWFRDPGELVVWEDIAEWFCRETGHLRPGKDKAPGFHQTEEGESDCCRDAWLKWTQEKRDKAMRSLLAERDALWAELAAEQEARAGGASRRRERRRKLDSALPREPRWLGSWSAIRRHRGPSTSAWNRRASSAGPPTTIRR